MTNSAASESSSLIRLASEVDFQIGGLRVRPSTREVAFQEQRLVLQPRVMQVLVALAQAGGRIVSRDELIERCWGGRVVSESALYRVISQLRKVSEIGEGAAFTLETVSSVGYAVRPGGDTEPEPPLALSADRIRASRRGLLIAGGAVGVGAAAAGVVLVANRAPRRLRIAVLPFDTADPELRVLADGLSEDLISSLLTVPGLDVVARSSTFELRGARKPAAEKELAATHVLDGSVQREGDRVRVNVHLIDARKQSTIWSQQYDAPLHDLFETQSRIARDAAGVLELAVTDGRIAEARIDPAAYRLFVEGRDLLNRRTPDAPGAIAKLTEAVDRAPGFSRGWSMLSTAYVAVQGTIDTAPYTPIARPAARSAAQKALELNPRNAQAYAALATATDRANAWARIENLYEKAIRFEPSNVVALYGAGNFYADVGWNDVSIRHLRRAQALDPLNPLATFLLLRILEAAGHDAELDAELRRSAMRWPGYRSLWRFSTRRAIWTMRLDEAGDLLRRAPPGAESDVADFQALIDCRRDPASPALARFTAAAHGGALPVAWPIFVFALGMLGQTAACVALIRRIYLSEVGRQQAPTWVLYQSMVRTVWRDAGLQDVLRQLGLSQFWSARGHGPDNLKLVGR